MERRKLAELSARAQNCLCNIGVCDENKFRRLTFDDFAAAPNLGPLTSAEICLALGFDDIAASVREMKPAYYRNWVNRKHPMKAR